MRVLIDKLRSGRYRVRAEDTDGKLKPVDTFDHRAEAVACRAAIKSIARDKSLPRDARTVGAHVSAWLKRRGANKNDQRRAEQHILTDPIAAMALRALGRRDVKAWIERLRQKQAKQRGRAGVYVDAGRTLSTKTIRECVTLLSGALADAVDDGMARENAAAGFRLARKSTRRAFSFLYPDEDARLIGCPGVPLPYRILYGVSAREGFRKGEELALTWGDLDLERGSVRLDENKTDDPRAWALDEGVVAVLAWWKSRRKDVAADDRVFVGALGEPLNTVRCARFRKHLTKAGVTRAELYERSAARMPIRVHDLRATFVTLSLAAGRTEAWVQDRTGHTTNAMLQRYRRAARTVAEIGLGPLLPFESLLPEMVASAQAAESGSENDPQSDPRAEKRAELLEMILAFFERETGLEPPSLSQRRREFPAKRAAADHLADQGLALARALRDGGDREIERATQAVANAAEAGWAEPADLVRRIRRRDPHRVFLAARLLDQLLPDAPGADRAGRTA